MKCKRWMIGVIALMFAVGMTACGTTPKKETAEKEDHKAQEEGHDHGDHSDDTAELPKVKMDLPDKIRAGKEAEIQVKITYEGKPVNDANDVKFEIWKKGASKDEHEKITAKKSDDGVYSIQKTFDKAGDYKIMYHVTAKGGHVMEPAETFTVQP